MPPLVGTRTTASEWLRTESPLVRRGPDIVFSRRSRDSACWKPPSRRDVPTRFEFICQRPVTRWLATGHTEVCHFLGSIVSSSTPIGWPLHRLAQARLFSLNHPFRPT